MRRPRSNRGPCRRPTLSRALTPKGSPRSGPATRLGNCGRLARTLLSLGPAGPRSDEPLVAPVRSPHARLRHACVRRASSTTPAVALASPLALPLALALPLELALPLALAKTGSHTTAVDLVPSAFVPSSHRRRFLTGHAKQSTPGPFNQVVRSSDRFATTKRSAIETIPSPLCFVARRSHAIDFGHRSGGRNPADGEARRGAVAPPSQRGGHSSRR